MKFEHINWDDENVDLRINDLPWFQRKIRLKLTVGAYNQALGQFPALNMRG